MNAEQQNNKEIDVWSLDLYAMKSPVTRVKYISGLEKFLDFIGMEGSTAEDKNKSFINNIKIEGNQGFSILY